MFVVWGVCRAGGVVPSTGVEVLGVEDTCESVIIGWLLMVLRGLSKLAIFLGLCWGFNYILFGR